MKRLVIALLLCLVGAAYAFTVNSQGVALAPIVVSNSAVKVLKGLTGRKAWCLYSETVSIRCNFGGTADEAPTAPTTTTGFLMAAQQLYCANSGANSNLPASVDPQQRVDCVSTGADSKTDTLETP